jgi:hypothetical protein
MTRHVTRFIALGLLGTVTSCSTGATSSTPAVQTANLAQTAKLQFAVGTATISWSASAVGVGGPLGSTTSPAGTFIGTNFTSSFRGPNGLSAMLVNTPTITGPPAFSFGLPGTPNSVSGILPNVFDAAVLRATTGQSLQNLPYSFGASLGPLTGVFGYGMAADNLLPTQAALGLAKLTANNLVCNDLNSAGTSETSLPLTVSPVLVGATGSTSVSDTAQAQSHELGLPLLTGLVGTTSVGGGNPNCPTDTFAGTVPVPFPAPGYPVNYYGGPPAWPSAQGYGLPSFFVGYPLGFTDFATPPVAGTYTLDVAYAANAASTSYAHSRATATLRNTNPLPPIAITSATVNLDGTIAVLLTVPPGLFETVVLVRTLACNNPNGPNTNFSIVTHAGGTQRLVFGANLGPPDASGRPTATTCNGYPGIAYAVGFDYPAYESSFPFDTSQTPSITNGDGHTGQADITTSAPIGFTFGS